MNNDDLTRLIESGAIIGTTAMITGMSLKLAGDYINFLNQKKLLKKPRITKRGNIFWNY